MARQRSSSAPAAAVAAAEAAKAANSKAAKAAARALEKTEAHRARTAAQSPPSSPPPPPTPTVTPVEYDNVPPRQPMAHHCGEPGCHKHTQSARFRNECLWKHMAPCAGFHGTLMKTGTQHLCAACIREDAARKKRESELRAAPPGQREAISERNRLIEQATKRQKEIREAGFRVWMGAKVPP
ncbi:hypothetical protein BZA77DRAFT_358041 [Pyronema omphalodes]|nr:hypothetical protein BZA77DRAFT_358041 [Pyronema omphalodes]